MTIEIGKTLPDTSFMTMTADGPTPTSTDDVFAGRRVALFAVPGAFTPTCSAQHLPSFVTKAENLKAKGIDHIACTAVNDIFVMAAWVDSEKAGTAVQILADGNGDFAQSVGLEMDATGFGMGKRSQRYAMIVNNKVVEKLFIEEAGGYEVSSAEHMLAHL